MNLAYVSRKNLLRLKKHAKESFPNECIGVFECYEDAGNFYITNIFECKNVARNKKISGLLPRKTLRSFNKMIKRGKRKGILYGAYHSHPVSGATNIGEQDMHSGMIYNIFKLQIILGVKRRSIRTAFWQTKNGNWYRRGLKTRSIR